MPNLKQYFNLYLGISILCWFVLLGIDLYTIYAVVNGVSFDDDNMSIFRKLILSLFFLFVFLSFKLNISKTKTKGFIEQLWQVFIIGAFTVFFSLFIKFFLYLLGEDGLARDIYLRNIVYHVNIGLITVFVANGFYVWKRMNLYQKSEITHQAWYIFELLVYLTILTNFPDLEIYSLPFLIISFPLIVFALILSFNVKWVAFLNYSQKWQSILLITLIVLITVTFLQQLYEQHQLRALIVDLWDNAFMLAMFGFIALNCFVSLLVLFFNLPTSSVFEQKFGEVMIFQRLSQSIQMGTKEDEVYSTLMDSSMNIAMADACWLEIVDEAGNIIAFEMKSIHEIDAFEIKKVLRKNRVNIDTEPHYIKNLHGLNETSRIKQLSFDSLLIIPLSSHNYKMGNLVLLKNLKDGFDKEMVDIIFTFTTQASIALKNFRLISEAVENERYKEELKIAKKVRESLLPTTMLVNIHLEISAFSKSADEIGGDYFDYYEYDKNNLSIAVGDVSGSGTSAAFNMALLKGVFQSLIQEKLSADSFMVDANNALSNCLERTSFVTLTLFNIDIENRSFEFTRAGHCLPLYYSAGDQKLSYLETRGLGLGLLRNKEYEKHIEKCVLSYKQGDVLILYTDGMLEATNPEGEEFGPDRLKEAVLPYIKESSKNISEGLLAAVYQFAEQDGLADDHTVLVLKFL